MIQIARITERNGKYKVIIELGRDKRTNKRLRHTKEGFTTKKAAKAYAALKETELLEGKNISQSNIVFKTFISNGTIGK